MSVTAAHAVRFPGALAPPADIFRIEGELARCSPFASVDLASLGDLRLWHAEFPADLPGERVRSFNMSGDGLDLAVLRIAPKLVLLALTLEKATVPAKVTEELSSFH